MSLHLRVQAANDLLKRYAALLRHHWRERHRVRTGFFNEREAEFLPARLSLQESPESPSLRWTARVLMLLVAGALGWAVLGRVDIIVNAPGKIIPSSRIKTIASVDLASVKALHVVEGQAVRAGDLLLELDSSSSDADRDKAVDAVSQAELQMAKATAMVEAVKAGRSPRAIAHTVATLTQQDAVNAQLQSQYADFRAKLARLDGEIERHGQALPLAERRAEDFRQLAADNTVSRHAWLEKEQARVDLRGQWTAARHQRAALIAETLKISHDAMIENQRIVAASIQDQRRAGERSRLLRLTAPVDGTVQQLAVHTVGGVVPAAQPLMQIVPTEGPIEVEAFLENRDVGFVQVGQDAEVKLDAFDYTKWGTLKARIVHVSRDAIQDEERGLIYSAKIALQAREMQVDGRAMPLSAGLSATVEVKTGTRRVIEYLLSPLMQHRREALRER